MGDNAVYLPKFNNQGQDFKYDITGEDSVDGYVPTFTSSDNKLTMTNTALGFQVQKYAKYGADSTKKLTGATFKLIKYTDRWQTPDSNSKAQEFKANTDLSSIKPGYYSIEESNAPQGYQLNNEKIKFQVTDKGEFLNEEGTKISRTSLPEDDGFYLDQAQAAAVLTYAQYDQLKPFDLTVLKVDQDNQQQKLKDAHFKLTGDEFEKELTTDQDGMISFTGLKPGKYSLQETKAPDGYTLLKDPIQITINSDGSVKFTDGTAGSAELTTGTAAHNTIKVTVKDRVQGILPKTGGHGISGYLLVGLTIILISLSSLIVFLRTKNQEV